MQLTRDKFVPLIDVSEQKNLSKLVRIDKSTKFELSFNAQTDTKGYICDKNDSTEVTGYQPELPEEIILDNTNPLFKFMFEYAKKFPIGTACNVPVVLGIPSMTTGATTDAVLWQEASIIIDTLNTVDGTLSFKIGLNGTPKMGTLTGLGTDNVKFVPAVSA